MNKQEWIVCAKKALEYKKLRKFYQEQEEKYCQKAQELAEYKDFCAGGMKLTYTVRKGSVNYKTIPLLQGLDLEPYRNKSVTIAKLEVDNDTIIGSLDMLNMLVG